MTTLYSLYNRYSIVKQIPIFSNLRWLDLQRIARKANIVDYKKGEIIRRQGNPPDAFYCLVSGRVQSYLINGESHKTNVEFIRRGMYFGVISLLTGESHSLTYEAINDSIVLKIEKEDFQAILKSIPHLGIELSQSLSKRLRSNRVPTKVNTDNAIVTVYSPVKGTGSSTYAINLAFSLQRETNKKVLFTNIVAVNRIEVSDSSKAAEASPKWKKTPVPIATIIDDYDKIIQSILRGEAAIDLLNVSFDSADTAIVSHISLFVAALVNDYDYVVVDLPNEMDDVVLKTLTQSDMVHLVTGDDPEDLQTTRQVIYKLEENLKENFNLEKIRVILSGTQKTSSKPFAELNSQIDFTLNMKLPHINSSELNVAIVNSLLAVVLPNPESDYAKLVRAEARKIGGVMVGLVLGGGAALGVAHVGIVRVLEREKIPIDIVVGSSMGALLASLWVTGSNAQQLEKIAREFQQKKAIWKLFDPVIPISGLVAGRAIRRWLRRHLGDKTFFDAQILLKVVAYDLIKREEIIIDSGDLVEAVRRSISIPGVIEPVLENDRVIIDGGVLNPLPTNVLTNFGIKKIIAVNVLQSPEDVTRGFMEEKKRLKAESKVVFREAPWRFLQVRAKNAFMKLFPTNISDIIVRSLQASEYVIAEQSARYADIVIHPDLAGINWFELYKVDELIKSGEEAAMKALPAIQKLVKE